MSEDVTTPAGWYDDGSGRQRWFDGTEWGAFQDEQESDGAESAPAGWYDDGSGRQRWFDGTEWGSFQDEQTEVLEEVAEELEEVAEDVDTRPVAPSERPAAWAPSETVDDGGPVVVRRSRRAPFAPPNPDQGTDDMVIVSRDWATGLRGAKKESGLTRNRKIAGDLPDWAPAPPGELVVKRPGAGR